MSVIDFFRQYLKKKIRKKTPTIFQMEAMECGAACLTMIMGYYGKFVPLSEVRAACDVTRDGSKASNIIEAANRYGLEAAGYSCSIEALDDVAFPCIIFWQFNHFVVLEGISGNSVYINDPASGPRTLHMSEFRKSFTGIVLEFKPTEHFQKSGTPPSNPIKLLWEWFTLEKKAVFCLSTLAFFLGLCSIFPVLLVKVFVDIVLIKQQEQRSWLMIFRIFSLACICGGLLWVLRYYLNLYVLKMKSITVSRFVWKLIHLPFSFFQQRMLGDIAARVSIYDQIGDFMANHFITSVITLIGLFFYLGTMFLISPKMAFVVLLFVMINLSAIAFLKNRMNRYGQNAAQKEGKLIATEVLTVENIESLKANAQENYYFEQWAGNQAEFVNATQSVSVTSSLLSLSPLCFLIFNKLAILGYGGYLILDGQMSVGGIIAFQYLSAGFYQPLPQVFGMVSALSQLRGHLCRVLDVQDYAEEKKNNVETLSEYPDAVLSVEHVTFGYSHLAPPLPMLTDFSLQLYPNKKIGIVGSSGSGKSTLLKLICAFYEPWKGGIYLKGQLIEKMTPKERARHMAYVSQEVYLFEGTVRDNLTLWNDDIEDSHIYEILEALDLAEMVHDRGGLSAPVEASGGNFSGGQRQRFEMARVLLLRPELLILDEATSALDNVTEKKVYAAAMKYANSLLIVAHRLSAIRDCDWIIVLSGGVIVETGTHESLMSANGFYAQQLVQSESA